MRAFIPMLVVRLLEADAKARSLQGQVSEMALTRKSLGGWGWSVHSYLTPLSRLDAKSYLDYEIQKFWKYKSGFT